MEPSQFTIENSVMENCAHGDAGILVRRTSKCVFYDLSDPFLDPIWICLLFAIMSLSIIMVMLVVGSATNEFDQAVCQIADDTSSSHIMNNHHTDPTQPAVGSKVLSIKYHSFTI